MLASFLCNLTLKVAGAAFPNFVEDFKAGNEASNSIHRAFIFAGDVLESASSTALRNVARNRSRHSNESLISGEILSELDSKDVVSPRSCSIES